MAGFTLLEVLVAIGLMITVAVGVAHLFALATRASAAARMQTSTTILAAAKLEQLRSLTWAYEPDASSPVPRSDLSANLSRDIPDASGTGLASSPPGTLTTNMPPFVDFLDLQGRWCGNGTRAPSGAIFVRRWSIQPLPQDPSRTLILSVRVTTVASDARGRSVTWRGRTEQETLLVGLKTRKDQ